MKNKNEYPKGICRICGCTDNDPCFNTQVGYCWWTDDSHTLCSHCADDKLSSNPETRHCVNTTSESNEPLEFEDLW